MGIYHYLLITWIGVRLAIINAKLFEEVLMIEMAMKSLKFLFLLFLCQISMAADFSLQSSNFKANDKIPTLHTCNGKNTSPQLSWSNPPANTESYALTVYSADWPAGFVYLWVLYDIPKTITSLAEDASNELPSSISVGSNYYRLHKYSGPCPPDSNSHHYVFTVYAIDTPTLNVEDENDTKEILRKINSHTLEKAELTVVFNH